ncbi:hypothetical protein [Bifidobacterium sp. SO1]|uniref:hypothetical protein n=1 Tax=Bifidobacterium sp. SO1 TaxID=2809029 RepID=UPI001BDC42EE|nr:hypothetical protein [Bifidobacterium sp. SO1]MBT1162126.1 hypothetical protein [Bifidobacterium sp. SO1]
MELGNLLFGNSRGEYPVDRTSEPCDLLEWLLIGLGCDINGSGRLDEDVRRRMEHAGFQPDWLVETTRGIDLHDPVSGERLLRTRAYWWDNGDDPEAKLPNLEIPALGFSLDWYKYMFRDSYANRPLTLGLINRMYELLMPVLTAMIPYVAYPVKADCEWDTSRRVMTVDGEQATVVASCRAASPDVDANYDHGIIRLIDDPNGRTPYRARMMDAGEHFICEAVFESIPAARSWCERRMVEWKEPHDGR